MQYILYITEYSTYCGSIYVCIYVVYLYIKIYLLWYLIVLHELTLCAGVITFCHYNNSIQLSCYAA